jgi:hypothetical protein
MSLSNRYWKADKITQQNTSSKPEVVAYTYNPNTWEVEVGGL